MTPEALLEATREKPFIPFRVHLSDGAHYDVRHPDQCMTLRHVAIIAAPASPEEQLPERAVKIDVRHVTRLEPLQATVPPG